MQQPSGACIKFTIDLWLPCRNLLKLIIHIMSFSIIKPDTVFRESNPSGPRANPDSQSSTRPVARSSSPSRLYQLQANCEGLPPMSPWPFLGFHMEFMNKSHRLTCRTSIDPHDILSEILSKPSSPLVYTVLGTAWLCSLTSMLHSLGIPAAWGSSHAFVPLSTFA